MRAEVDVVLGGGGADTVEPGPGPPVRRPGVRGGQHLQVVVHPGWQDHRQGPGGRDGGLVQVVFLREERARDRDLHPRPHGVGGDQGAVGDQQRRRGRGIDPPHLFPGVPRDHSVRPLRLVAGQRSRPTAAGHGRRWRHRAAAGCGSVGGEKACAPVPCRTNP